MKAERILVAALALLGVGCAPGGTGGRQFQPIYGPGTTGIASAQPGSTSTGGGSGNIGTFSAGPSMAFARENHTATVFPKAGSYSQGGVLVVGGDDGNNGLYPDSEVFDPVANKWTQTSQLNANAGLMKNKNAGNATCARANHVAVVNQSGRVLISGGLGVDGSKSQVLKTAFLFDPATNAFSQVDDAPTARFWHQGCLLSTGKILVCTGLDDKGVTSHSADLFDGISKWTPVGGAANTAVTDAHFGAVVVGQGNKALVASGANVKIVKGRLTLDTPPFPSVKTEIYDSATDKFTPGPSLNDDRVFFGGCTIAQGDSFFAGGLTLSAQGGNDVLATINRFDHTAGKFTPTGPMVQKRMFCLATEVDAGKTGNFVVTGGEDDQGNTLKSAEVWQFKINAVAQPKGKIDMTHARESHAQAQLNDGRMIVTGGFDGQAVTKTTDIYKD